LKGISLIRFLDIAFRLEHEFGIKIPRGELFSDRVFELCTRIVRDVQVTDEGLAALRLAMPYAVRGTGRCSQQPGKKAATSHRLSSYRPRSVTSVECQPRSREMAESISSALAISQPPRKSTSHLRHSSCFIRRPSC
jgi:hypothetical protein